jgi:hypothetical protein
MTEGIVHQKLRGLIERDETSDVETLHALYDGLAAIDEPAFLHGDWEGGVIRTGHAGESQLGALGWAGKTFNNDDDVDPIVVRNKDGQREASGVMGKASLRVVRYRGVATATMVYDRHPIFDHFRKVDDDLVLGVMDRKGDAQPLFFWLARRAADRP